MSKQPEIGSTHLIIDAPGLRAVALVQLIATVTLALCTLIVATAVSFGLARADVAASVVSMETSAAAGEISSSDLR